MSNKKVRKCWWIFFHEWEQTDEPVKGMMSSEQYYWGVLKCVKCGRRKTVMKVYREEVNENE